VESAPSDSAAGFASVFHLICHRLIRNANPVQSARKKYSASRLPQISFMALRDTSSFRVARRSKPSGTPPMPPLHGSHDARQLPSAITGTTLAWFLNLYRCKRCERRWAGEWSARCDDDCPYCGARAVPPQQSEEVTTVIETDRDEYVVLWSPETAKDEPDYRELGRFRSRAKAIEFLSVES
jgi:hypothetical protein